MRFAQVAVLSSLLLAPALVGGTLVDVCAAVNVDLFALLGLGKLGLIVGGVIDVCLCISALPVFIQTNAITILVADLVGVGPLTDALTGVINGATGSKQCTYPDHCTTICAKSDPCGFNCIDGYSKSGSDCICLPPKFECNGKCTDKPCPSGKAKRDMGKRDMFPLENLCSAGEELCGVWSGYSAAQAGHAWECLNTQKNLESCGGCVTPLPGNRASGRDCTSIPGVASVECVWGECVVSRCKSGWKVNHAGNGCFNGQESGFTNADVLIH